MPRFHMNAGKALDPQTHFVRCLRVEAQGLYMCQAQAFVALVVLVHFTGNLGGFDQAPWNVAGPLNIFHFMNMDRSNKANPLPTCATCAQGFGVKHGSPEGDPVLGDVCWSC